MSYKVAVIPARYESSRLKHKLLLDLAGKSVLQRTYEQVKQATSIDEVVIATDHEKIYEHARAFGARTFMTALEHNSGTDRISELAQKNSSWDLIVNVQGDEPFIDPQHLDLALQPFEFEPQLEMTSLYHEIGYQEAVLPSNVKVVVNLNSDAMYFSRALIPMIRDDTKSRGTKYLKHIGLYVYRRETLLELASLPASKTEQLEKLEQLRALENQIKIRMLKVAEPAISIDTREDYLQASALLKN
jgi:3-deoxy-manno-octulosonate cytidylyltransferase (CMP-KDO synthetase)